MHSAESQLILCLVIRQLLTWFHLKMTSAQVVETSVTNNSLSKDYLHLNDHAKQITDTVPLGSNHLPYKLSVGNQSFRTLGFRITHQSKVSGNRSGKTQLWFFYCQCLLDAIWISQQPLASCFNAAFLQVTEFPKRPLENLTGFRIDVITNQAQYDKAQMKAQIKIVYLVFSFTT